MIFATFPLGKITCGFIKRNDECLPGSSTGEMGGLIKEIFQNPPCYFKIFPTH